MRVSDLPFMPQILTFAQDAATAAAPGWGSGGGADGAAGGAAAPLGGGGGAGPGGGSFMFMMLAFMGIFIMMTIFSGRKERKRRAELLANLKKNVKVQTVGGIIGTIVEIRKEDVVLRVDENSNVRIRFARSAITGVISEPPVSERVEEVKVVKNEAEPVGSAS